MKTEKNTAAEVEGLSVDADVVEPATTTPESLELAAKTAQSLEPVGASLESDQSAAEIAEPMDRTTAETSADNTLPAMSGGTTAEPAATAGEPGAGAEQSGACAEGSAASAEGANPEAVKDAARERKSVAARKRAAAKVGSAGGSEGSGAARKSAANDVAGKLVLRVGDRVRLPVVVAAATAVVVAGAGFGFGAWHFAGQRQDAQRSVASAEAQAVDRESALGVGVNFLATAYSVDSVNDKGMAKWNAAMTAATTDTLKEQVRQSKAMLSLLAESNASMTGVVSESAVISQNDTLIRMLAVVKLTGKAPGQAEPTTGSATEYVDLMKVGGQWKVFGYKDIGSKAGAGAGLPGLAAPAK